MINKFYQNSNIEKFIVIIFPLLLITGPALPDITAVLLSIYFLLFKIKKNFKKIINSYWIISFIALWLWFLIISLFAYNQITSFSDGIIFFRFIVFTVAIYFIFSEIDFKFLKILFYISLLIFSFVTLDTLFQFYNYDSALGFKGDIFGIARVAGIMAAKKTHELIPLCHPLSISAITIDFELDDKNFSIKVRSQCKLDDKTGLEMEALIAVSIAALTIYDMCKSVDKNIIISDVKLLEKSGGKSGKFKRKW